MQRRAFIKNSSSILAALALCSNKTVAQLLADPKRNDQNHHHLCNHTYRLCSNRSGLAGGMGIDQMLLGSEDL